VLELVLRFLGPWGKTFYQTILMMLMFVGLIAYTQVFVNTFISQLFPTLSTFFPSLLFGMIAIPLSCIDLAEQISIQVIMSILRFLSLATLLFGTLVALFIDPHPSSTSSPSSSSPSSSSSLDEIDPIPYYQFTGFGLMFTTAIFSQLFQHSVPGLIRPLQIKDKQHVSTIFSFALFTTGSIYICIGIICTIYFKSFINQAINLNFVNYYWGLSPPSPPELGGDGPSGASPGDGGDGNEGMSSKYISQYLFFLFIKFLSMLIVLFPALDTLSVFPLIANTLGNNFHAAFPKGYKQTSKYLQYLPHSMIEILLKSSATSSSSSSARELISITPTAYSPTNSYLTRRLTLRLWRLFVAFPPVIISMYVTNLSLTLQFAGTCGVIVALVIPALLQYYSLHEVPDIPSMINQRKYNPSGVYFEPNPYSGRFSHLSYVYLVLLIAFGALIVCIIQIITSLTTAATTA
jgi:hypothetical protein